MFLDVWTIINNATIFYNLATRLFSIDKYDPLFEKIKGIEYLRHSQQHIDERIDEVLLEKQLPIYGSLSWYAQEESNSMKGKIVTIDSGTISSRQTINPPTVNPVGKINDKRINDVEFSMVIKIQKRYEVKTIKLNELMVDLALIINHFDNQLIQQLEKQEPVERHISDLTIILDLERIRK